MLQLPGLGSILQGYKQRTRTFMALVILCRDHPLPLHVGLPCEDKDLQQFFRNLVGVNCLGQGENRDGGEEIFYEITSGDNNLVDMR